MATGSQRSVAGAGWALRLDGDAAHAMAALRLEPAIEVAVDGNSVWLRGNGAGDELRRRLDALPASARFVWLPPDRLCPVGSRIPSGQLPGSRWQGLQSWLRVTSDPGRLPGRLPERAGLRLVESGVEREAELLRTDLGALREYLRGVARLRWVRLGFAVAAAGGEVLVRGTPLAALPGQRWARVGRVYVPVGFHWSPAVEPAVVEKVFLLAANEWLVWLPARGEREAGSGEVIRLTEEQFVPLTPSAVRATAREVRS